MATPRKTPRRQLRGGPSTGDRIVRLNFIHRAGFLGNKLLGRSDRYLVIPEPDEELEGSELTDGERYQAMMRERTRREGLE
ncbi:MAG: hypothetical protein AB7P33_03365 [Dehalococcoidia bacterium]